MADFFTRVDQVASQASIPPIWLECMIVTSVHKSLQEKIAANEAVFAGDGRDWSYDEIKNFLLRYEK